MKRFKQVFTTIVLVLMCVSVHSSDAGTRTFEWDANDPANSISGYKAYRSNAPDVQKNASNLWLTLWNPDTSTIPTGPSHMKYAFTDSTNSTCTITVNVLPAGKWYFRWTAFNADDESGTSNEVDTTIYDKPSDPAGLRCFKR